MKFTILVDPSSVIITIYLVCLIYGMPGSRAEDFKRNNAFSLNDLYGHAPAQEPLPRGQIIYNLGRPFLGHQYYTLSLTEAGLGVEYKIFKEKHKFYTFYPQITSPWDGGGGHEIYNFLSPDPTDATYQIW